jgi:hypothetical protein
MGAVVSNFHDPMLVMEYMEYGRFVYNDSCLGTVCFSCSVFHRVSFAPFVACMTFCRMRLCILAGTSSSKSSVTLRKA